MQHVARHIETRKGMEGLVEQLHHQLSGSELNTLLLELFRRRLEEQLTGLPGGMALHLEEQPEPNAYYHTVQFKFFIRHQEAEINLIDGGFVPWTQDLLQNRKHRLLISGAGTDLLLKLKLGLI